MQPSIVIYVDDEQLCCRYFARLSKSTDIRTFVSAASALAFLEEHGDMVQLLISDQRMPEMQGVDLLRTVMEKYPHIERVLTTGFSENNDIQQLKDEGLISSCLHKPWNMQEVRTLLG